MKETFSKIDGTILIEEIAEKHPELIRPLREYGIVCIRCGEPIWESLAQVASEKGIENIILDKRHLNQERGKYYIKGVITSHKIQEGTNG